jgi:hypothetical protein
MTQKKSNRGTAARAIAAEKERGTKYRAHKRAARKLEGQAALKKKTAARLKKRANAHVDSMKKNKTTLGNAAKVGIERHATGAAAYQKAPKYIKAANAATDKARAARKKAKTYDSPKKRKGGKGR